MPACRCRVDFVVSLTFWLAVALAGVGGLNRLAVPPEADRANRIRRAGAVLLGTWATAVICLWAGPIGNGNCGTSDSVAVPFLLVFASLALPALVGASLQRGPRRPMFVALAWVYAVGLFFVLGVGLLAYVMGGW